MDDNNCGEGSLFWGSGVVGEQTGWYKVVGERDMRSLLVSGVRLVLTQVRLVGILILSD